MQDAQEIALEESEAESDTESVDLLEPEKAHRRAKMLANLYGMPKFSKSVLTDLCLHRSRRFYKESYR